jgi:hypothetical protein
MSKEVNIFNEVYSLERIKTTRGNIEIGDHIKDDSDIDKLTFAFDITFKYSIKESIVILGLTIDVIALNKADQQVEISASYTNEFIFKVNNLIHYFPNKEEIKSFPAELGLKLVSIAYGTSRGLIFTRTQGTIFSNGIILPIITPQDIVNATISKLPSSTKSPKNKRKASKSSKKP